jgi:hypothetical protein
MTAERFEDVPLTVETCSVVRINILQSELYKSFGDGDPPAFSWNKNTVG